DDAVTIGLVGAGHFLRREELLPDTRSNPANAAFLANISATDERLFYAAEKLSQYDTSARGMPRVMAPRPRIVPGQRTPLVWSRPVARRLPRPFLAHVFCALKTKAKSAAASRAATARVRRSNRPDLLGWWANKPSHCFSS